MDAEVDFDAIEDAPDEELLKVVEEEPEDISEDDLDIAA
jgi:hypothetical protein